MLQDAFLNYTEQRENHYNQLAAKYSTRSIFSKTYHNRLEEVFRTIIPEGAVVLELGCGFGDLLSALKPSLGVGIDLSEYTLEIARQRYPDLCFEVADAHTFEYNLKFDYVILSDLINDAWDLQLILKQIKKVSKPSTRVIFNYYSRVWEPFLGVAQMLKLAKPVLTQNWFTPSDVNNILAIEGFDVVKSWQEFLMPLPIPIVTGFVNKFLVKVWPFNQLALTHFLVTRPMMEQHEQDRQPTVSVLVPARNEAGNIQNIFKRVSEMGGGVELIFVEGNSSDKTYETIEAEISNHPERKCKLFKQTGKGKGDAVRLGFSQATGDILMILDADMTVAPEDLPKFYDVIVQNKAEFVNGVRLVYPMEEHAMRFFNFLGNKFFSWAFSYLLNQPVKDTLCGTKVLWRSDYERIVDNRSYFGNFDPFGDFDLLFGASKLSLKIADLPIRYRDRLYGTTNISRWKHGVLLLRMVLFASKRLKFI